jgi:hypothetical protein
MGLPQLWQHPSGTFKRLQLLLNGLPSTLKHFSDWLIRDDEQFVKSELPAANH